MELKTVRKLRGVFYQASLVVLIPLTILACLSFFMFNGLFFTKYYTNTRLAFGSTHHSQTICWQVELVAGGMRISYLPEATEEITLEPSEQLITVPDASKHRLIPRKYPYFELTKHAEFSPILTQQTKVSGSKGHGFEFITGYDAPKTSSEQSRRWWTIAFPAILLLLPWWLLVFWVLRKEFVLRKRIRNNHCVHCGYNVGLRIFGAICPECGRKLSNQD